MNEICPSALITTHWFTPPLARRSHARRSLSPVPERLWAMRNVANGMVRSGQAAQLGEAVAMLQQV